MYSQLEIFQKNCDKFYIKMYGQSYDLLWIELWGFISSESILN